MKPSRVVLLFALGLTGCGSGAATNPSPCPPTPQVVVAPPSLISPQSGASGIAFNGLNVRITYNPANDGTLRLVDQNGASVQGPAFMTFQTVSFSAGAPSSTTTDAEAVSPPLRPHTLYTVFVDAVYPPAGPCPVPGPTGPTSYQLGTFTTASPAGTAALRASETTTARGRTVD